MRAEKDVKDVTLGIGWNERKQFCRAVSLYISVAVETSIVFKFKVAI